MGSIKFVNVNKVYPNGFHAIHDFNLDVKDGEFIVFVGPSGCGKSTVLRMLAGLEEISSGDLLLDGEKVNDRPPVDRDIAIVFQDYALYGNMSIYDNVGMSMTVRHEKQADIYDKVQEASAMVDLQPYLKRMPSQLSGGQKQRVALARSMVRCPKAFLLDEPLSNLDAKLRSSTRVEIAKLHQKLKATMIYVTHDQTEAITLADRIVVMKLGVVQQIGTPREIYFAPANMFVAGFIGAPQMNFIKGHIEDKYFVSGKIRLALPAEVVSKLGGYQEKELVLGLRPESFAVVSHPSTNVFDAVIDSYEFMGSHGILHVDIGEQQIVCTTETQKKEPLEHVLIEFQTNRLYFFDGETEELVFHTNNCMVGE